MLLFVGRLDWTSYCQWLQCAIFSTTHRAILDNKRNRQIIEKLRKNIVYLQLLMGIHKSFLVMIDVLNWIFKIFLSYWVQLFTVLRLPLSLGCRACIEWLQMIWNAALDSILSSFQQQWLQKNFQLLCMPSSLNL